MRDVLQEERTEIYEGWVAFATHVVQQGFELAELPDSFVWKPTLQFILHESYGMGGAVVHSTEKIFAWPTDKNRTA
jgi:hypothetical protein